MATIAIKQMEVIGNTLSLPIPVLHAAEGTSQSWDRGQLIVLSSGVAVIAADDATVATLLGQALADATGTTGADAAYTPFIPGVTLIEANLCADDAGAVHTLVATDFGVAIGVGLVSGNFVLAVDETTDTKIIAKPLYCAYGSAVGDVNARVIAVVIGSVFTDDLSA